MTYDDNPELVNKVLKAELDRQRSALARSLEQLAFINDEIRPLMEKRVEVEREIGAARALVEGIEKTLETLPPAPVEDDFTGAVEEPAEEDSGNGYSYAAPTEEDPYDVAFGTTEIIEPSKTDTFAEPRSQRAPLMGEPGF